jgi:N-acyl-D-aspartate/D-glutamate deacylase
VFSRRDSPGTWKRYLDLLDETAAAGGRMFAQAHSRSLSALLSFKTQMPFDHLPVWKDIRKLPIEEQKQKLRDPALRRKLIETSGESDGRKPLGTEARLADYDRLLVLDTVEGPHRSVAQVARERGEHPAETMIDLALEKDLDFFFLQPVANEDQDVALEIMRHPRTVTTFSDSGAHVSQLMDERRLVRQVVGTAGALEPDDVVAGPCGPARSEHRPARRLASFPRPHGHFAQSPCRHPAGFRWRREFQQGDLRERRRDAAAK